VLVKGTAGYGLDRRSGGKHIALAAAKGEQIGSASLGFYRSHHTMAILSVFQSAACAVWRKNRVGRSMARI
jgi:hypothetical protein